MVQGKIETIRNYRKNYKNYISIILNLLRKKETIKVITREGSIAKLNPSSIYLLSRYINLGYEPREIINALNRVFEGDFGLIENELSIVLYLMLKEKLNVEDSLKCLNSECIQYNGLKVQLHSPKKFLVTINEIFIQEEYKSLNVKDKLVIDIGANIGDSAIYFALKGANKIIALEPYPYLHSFAKRNIVENNMDDKIMLLNQGYGKDGITNVPKELLAWKDVNNLGHANDNEISIQIRSLTSLINEFGIKNAILKMDCEGCELNLLHENNQSLRAFEQIQIEYHYGYKKLIRKLNSAGFKTKCTKPIKFYSQDSNSMMEVGWIYGIRID